MTILRKLTFVMLTVTTYYFSISYITKGSEEIADAEMQRFRAKLDPRFAKEHIKQMKEEAYKEGFEKGRLEEDKSVALQMLADGMKEEQIAKYTKLTVGQIQELNAH